MNTQTKTLDTNRRLGIGSYDSEEQMRDISREDYVSQASMLWAPWQTPFSEDMADISKDSINLRDEYQWLICYIWLPEEYNIADIDPDTILLNGRIGLARYEVKDELQLLIAKFSWSQIEKMLGPGEFEFTVSGQLINGTSFDSSDTVTVIDEEKE